MPSDIFAVWDSPAAAVETDSKKTDTDPKVPNGTYKCRTVGWRFFKSGPDSKYPGVIYMVWEFAIMKGMYDGRMLVKMCSPFGKPHDDEDWKATQAKWARTDLFKVLERVPPVNELLNPETLQTGPVVTDIVGSVVEVTLNWKESNGKRYANCKIERRVSGPPAGEPEKTEAELPPLPDAPSPGTGTADPETDLLDEIPF